MYKKSKGGISLIVLVITIIVMIILAAAIILSLSNSGIIGKANKAKTDTDLASAKEVIALAKADWEFMDEVSRSNYSGFVAYAEEKLEKAGIDKTKYTVSEDGKIEMKDGGGIIYKELAKESYSLEPTASSTSELKLTIDASKITDEYVKIPSEGVFKLFGDGKLPITNVIFTGVNETVKGIVFPEGMTTLNFDNNLVALENLDLPDSCVSGDTVKYSNCLKLKTITCNGTYISRLYGAIPNLEKLTITGGALGGSDLLSSDGKPSDIYLKKSVTSVNFSAFPGKGCVIHYEGTQAEFEAIYQKSGSAHKTWGSTTVVEFSDGTQKSIIDLDS